MTAVLKNILVIRNDKLGDFMLAYPAFCLLKKSLPDCKITALVPEYTKAAAEICPWIDDVVVQDDNKSISQNRVLAKRLKLLQFDAVISLFSNKGSAITTWLAGIPYRLAPATKWVQFFYNQRLVQRRSRSAKPEYEYNIDLIKKFLDDYSVQQVEGIAPPYLSFSNQEIQQLRQAFITEHSIDTETRLIFVHPGSGGSSNNLSLEQYAELIESISTKGKLLIVITAGPGEDKIANKLLSMISVPATVFSSSKGLLDFMKHQAFCDCFISGSTGTLHTAGALNCKTIAFYPRKRSSTSLRWQTCNDEERRLGFMPPVNAKLDDLRSINIKEISQDINDFLSKT